jgi:hypothetical protein
VRRLNLFVALLAAVALVRPTPAADAKGAAPIHVLPGGVADADGKYGYLANPDGHVVALDLETGKPLWESQTAGRPVANVGGWVWVQARDKDKANVLRVIGLKQDDGKAGAQSDPIALPEWIDATPGIGAGRSFASSARLDGLDLFLKWKADVWYWGGRDPTPQEEAAAKKHADGVARVNLETNAVEMLETAKAPPDGPKVSDKLRNAAARNYEGAKLTVATAGDYAVAVDLDSAGANKQKVVLKRWDLATEKRLDPVVLAEGATYKTVTVPSVGVAFVGDATIPPGGFPDEGPWTVYDLTTGKELGRFKADFLAAEFTVVGPRAFYVVSQVPRGPLPGGILPRTLNAADLKTGKRLWEQPLDGERLPLPLPK